MNCEMFIHENTGIIYIFRSEVWASAMPSTAIPALDSPTEREKGIMQIFTNCNFQHRYQHLFSGKVLEWRRELTTYRSE